MYNLTGYMKEQVHIDVNIYDKLYMFMINLDTASEFQDLSSKNYLGQWINPGSRVCMHVCMYNVNKQQLKCNLAQLITVKKKVQAVSRFSIRRKCCLIIIIFTCYTILQFYSRACSNISNMYKKN